SDGGDAFVAGLTVLAVAALSPGFLLQGVRLGHAAAGARARTLVAGAVGLAMAPVSIATRTLVGAGLSSGSRHLQGWLRANRRPRQLSPGRTRAGDRGADTQGDN